MDFLKKLVEELPEDLRREMETRGVETLPEHMKSMGVEGVLCAMAENRAVKDALARVLRTFDISDDIKLLPHAKLPGPMGLASNKNTGKSAIAYRIGLLLQCNIEDLEPILAHEIGHYVSGHATLDPKNDPEAARECEFIADRAAAQHGYGPGLIRYFETLVEKDDLARSLHGHECNDFKYHPSLRRRIAAIKAYLESPRYLAEAA